VPGPPRPAAPRRAARGRTLDPSHSGIEGEGIGRGTGSEPCGATCEREKGEDGAPDLIHSTELPAREPSMAAGGGRVEMERGSADGKREREAWLG
jgi:hypothetical protein